MARTSRSGPWPQPTDARTRSGTWSRRRDSCWVAAARSAASPASGRGGVVRRVCVALDPVDLLARFLDSLPERLAEGRKGLGAAPDEHDDQDDDEDDGDVHGRMVAAGPRRRLSARMAAALPV